MVTHDKICLLRWKAVFALLVLYAAPATKYGLQFYRDHFILLPRAKNSARFRPPQHPDASLSFIDFDAFMATPVKAVPREPRDAASRAEGRPNIIPRQAPEAAGRQAAPLSALRIEMHCTSSISASSAMSPPASEIVCRHEPP